MKAKHSGWCGHCGEAIAPGAEIVHLDAPHNVRRPGRYGDWNRSYNVTTRYAHLRCAHYVQAKKAKQEG
jgi:hypothetical protein